MLLKGLLDHFVITSMVSHRGFSCRLTKKREGTVYRSEKENLIRIGKVRKAISILGLAVAISSNSKVNLVINSELRTVSHSPQAPGPRCRSLDTLKFLHCRRESGSIRCRMPQLDTPFGNLDSFQH
jgi:hypothetical protein